MPMIFAGRYQKTPEVLVDATSQGELPYSSTLISCTQESSGFWIIPLPENKLNHDLWPGQTREAQRWAMKLPKDKVYADSLLGLL